MDGLKQGMHKNNTKSLKKLLILSCSNKKRNISGAAALEVYDGPSYKILRKTRRNDLDILILSAKYGLIGSETPISIYNQKMTRNIARETRGRITNQLSEFLASRNYGEIYVELGKTYMNAIDFGSHKLVGQNFIFDSGTIGVRLHNLKMWLSKPGE